MFQTTFVLAKKGRDYQEAYTRTRAIYPICVLGDAFNEGQLY